MELIHEKIKTMFSFKVVEYNNESKNSIGLHWHENMEMCRMIDGNCDFKVGDKEYLAQKGDIIFINAGEIHSIDKNHGPYKMSIGTLNPSILYNISAEIGFPKSHIKFDELQKKGISRNVEQCFEELSEENVREDGYSKLLCQANWVKIYGLLLRFFQTKVPENQVKNRISFQKILEYISENYSDSVTLETVSRKFNYNPVYISKMFRTATGVNFKYYIDNIRIRKSVELLMNSDFTITEIALSCGYDNIRTFNNVFKRIMGVSPGEIRKAKNFPI